MNQIRVLFEKSVDLSENEWALFSSKLTMSQFPKKTILLKKGQTERHLSFIERGVVRLFIPGEENDLTFGFAFANTFMSGYDSFLTQKPSTYQIETLLETVLWRISYSDLQIIYRETHAGNIIGRLASEDLFLKKSKRELSLLTDSAQQRYIALFTERPDVIRQIPLKFIASYIGVTPQALSRIRKRIS